MGRKTIVAAAALVCAIFAASGDVRAVDSGKTLTWPGGGRGEVRFEGKEHAKKGHACKDCHSGLFSMKYGTAAMTMAVLDSGQYCGACHNGTVVFSTKDPKKCHECHRGGSKYGKHEEHKDKKHKKDDKTWAARQGAVLLGRSLASDARSSQMYILSQKDTGFRSLCTAMAIGATGRT